MSLASTSILATSQEEDDAFELFMSEHGDFDSAGSHSKRKETSLAGNHFSSATNAFFIISHGDR